MSEVGQREGSLKTLKALLGLVAMLGDGESREAKLSELVDVILDDEANQGLSSEEIVAKLSDVFNVTDGSALSKETADIIDGQLRTAYVRALEILAVKLLDRVKKTAAKHDDGPSEARIGAEVAGGAKAVLAAELPDEGQSDADFEQFLNACLAAKQSGGIDALLKSRRVTELFKIAVVEIKIEGHDIIYSLTDFRGSFKNFSAVHREMRLHLSRFERGTPEYIAFGELYDLVGRISSR